MTACASATSVSRGLLRMRNRGRRWPCATGGSAGVIGSSFFIRWMESFKTKTAQEVSDWLHSEGLSLEICEIFEDLYCYMLAVANDLSAVMLHLYYHTKNLVQGLVV